MVIINLTPKLADVDIDDIGLWIGVVTPHLFQNPGAAEDFALPAQEKLQ